MMPHILFLLLIASSPFYTLGDGTASWGTLSSGPSESECRPYIEKALQGASIHDSPSHTGDTDDGGTETQEPISQSEISDSESSENPPESVETGQLDENQPESTELNENAEPSRSESNNEEASGNNESEETITEDKTETLSDAPTQSEEQVEVAVEGLSDEEETEVRSEISGENEHSSEQLVNADSTESNEDLAAEKENEEGKQSTEDEQTSGEIVGEAGEEASDQPDPSSGEIDESKDDEQGSPSQESPGGEESQESSIEAGVHDSPVEVGSHDASVEGENQEAPVEESSEEPQAQDESKGEDVEQSQEEESEQPSKEEEASNEAQEVEESNEGASADEGNDSIGDEASSISQVTDEPASGEVEESETPVEIVNETEKDSDLADKIDDNSEEATDEKSTEEGEVHSGETKDEPEGTQKDEDISAPEGTNESEEEEPAAGTTNASEESASNENLETETSVDSNETLQQESVEQIDGEPASQEADVASGEAAETAQSEDVEDLKSAESSESEGSGEPSNVAEDGGDNEETSPEEELSVAIEVPEKLRSREHMGQILRLNAENEDIEKLLSKTMESTLRELKKLYDNAIKPLEILYKYRDLSNRHFGDPEIFSKPLILFMGPWSGGKSTIINYLLENEYKNTALRTGAEPSPAYFNIVMWGDHEEVLDGTQLAADWTFSGLQKFGQGLLDRLRGLRLNHPLLEKVNIVEIPGILEIRKQVERLFPFNDACQWFIDRADIIFLVYDPSKLDVGPETEAILDQLKGREMQTRIILNKADQVKPEELMRVQGTLIWNISPLMSSTEPPVMYSTSLWSIPYESGAPARLLYAQERAFLKDLRDAIDKRVENKIASARRFAVRVRNHAKMVDCYLTTYYNHKSFFGNKKKISDDIIEHPQNYHIYEGLSTLTNISRYDLPDPDVYRDFFRLNPVYEFQQLSATCTYFRGCPINRLDVAIAYDLPELVGKYKKNVEEVLNSVKKDS